MGVTKRKPVGMVVRPSPPISYEPPGLGRLRKVAILGTAGTWVHAPFYDPSWEIWAHSSAVTLLPRVDRIFDLHPEVVWKKKKSWHKDYQRFLTRCPVPVYMQQHYAEVPQSIRYPKERVLAEFRRYFTSQAAWMIALALTEGVTHLGFFGVHYAMDSERRTQRAGCEYWMGVAEGRGVQIVLPVGCPLVREPSLLYGYENYDKDGKQIGPAAVDVGFDPSKLTVFDPADPKAARPKLATLDEPPAWDRSGHQHRY